LVAYCAYPPPVNIAITFLSVISSVTGSTKYPAHSKPIIFVIPLGGGYLPYDFILNIRMSIAE